MLSAIERAALARHRAVYRREGSCLVCSRPGIEVVVGLISSRGLGASGRFEEICRELGAIPVPGLELYLARLAP